MRYLIWTIVLVAFWGCSGQTGLKDQDPEKEQTPGKETGKSGQQDFTIRPGEDVFIRIETPYGSMKAILYNKTPKHRDNFISLVGKGWFENSPFHRVINHFMIQGGGNADGREDAGYRVAPEFVKEYFHKKGVLAAAREGDNVNPGKESSSCQFYIVQGKPLTDQELDGFESRGNFNYTAEQRNTYKTLGGTPHLDYNYTVFGEVVEGLEVIDKIAAVPTGPGDRPIDNVPMKISLITNK